MPVSDAMADTRAEMKNARKRLASGATSCFLNYFTAPRVKLPGINSLVESLVGEGSVNRKCPSNQHYLGVNPDGTHRLAVAGGTSARPRKPDFSARSRDVNSRVRKDQAHE